MQRGERTVSHEDGCQLCECRICLDEDYEENMVDPCLCKGSQRFAHEECLIMYVTYSKLVVIETKLNE
jgi:E3 ubiquitin-protein ligase DOA10